MGQLSSGRARSVVAVTIRARMMATRRRDRGSEDESAKSNSGGRTGADVEADPAAAPGGTLQYQSDVISNAIVIIQKEQYKK
ncbi:hypothetical protein T09_10781 [Trichinella sp. T9]|nr:hypothetical protein T09_10781 [Trichinella sp. T9]